VRATLGSSKWRSRGVKRERPDRGIEGNRAWKAFETNR